MKFEFINDPVPLIIIRDFFDKDINKAILKEVIINKKNFKAATIGSGKKVNFRSNNVVYYDELYSKDRSKSILLKSLDSVFGTNMFREIVSSSPYPINLFTSSNYHETQVSRYGDDGQKYKYHIDTFDNNTRQLSLVYYFHEEPKKWKGGDIQFTNCPIYKGKPIDKKYKRLTLTPENNMAVIFGAHTAHMVMPTKSPKTFKYGRFSVNCWIGRR